MTILYAEHHLIASLSVSTACLQLLGVMPETDQVLEMRTLLEDQFEIIECLTQSRHFGSDALDHVIQDCHNVLEQISEFKKE